MINKVGIIIGSEADMLIMQEAIKVLKEYEVPFEINTISLETRKERLYELSEDIYSRGVRVIIAGTRGEPSFTNSVASFFNIPTIGIPCKSLILPNSLETVFSVLQQPNDFAVANVAFDSGQNAGILAVQILALSDEKLQEKIVVFKENLKNKILKANEEIAHIKYENKTN